MGRLNNGRSFGRRTKSGAMAVPILSTGLFLVCGVTALTFFTVRLSVNAFNADADAAYEAAYNSYISGVKQEQSSDSTMQGVSVDKHTNVIEIDGRWYIASGSTGSDIPVFADPDSTIVINGIQYMLIDANTNVSAEATTGGGETAFYGNEYVVVDIDGNMVYLVEKGDTLTDVSGRVGYSVQELAQFNSIRDVNLIYNGQTLRVPAPQEAVDYVRSQKGVSDLERMDDLTGDMDTPGNDDISLTDDLSDTGSSPVIGIQ